MRQPPRRAELPPGGPDDAPKGVPGDGPDDVPGDVPERTVPTMFLAVFPNAVPG